MRERQKERERCTGASQAAHGIGQAGNPTPAGPLAAPFAGP